MNKRIGEMNRRIDDLASELKEIRRLADELCVDLEEAQKQIETLTMERDALHDALKRVNDEMNE